PASCSFSTAIICSSVNRCFFIRPSFNGPDSNPFWRKFAVAGQFDPKEKPENWSFEGQVMNVLDEFL
ncbi:hypothetical protein, partial [Rhizobium leguminosarum]|uniref:hypothetical protein n=1 Tax=Rhizobium leguminosarum TaxID=384 RepID=UPI001C955109